MPRPVARTLKRPTPMTDTKPKPTAPTILKNGGTLNTAEVNASITGIHAMFIESVKRYGLLIGESARVQAQVEMAEKMVCLVRDQLELTITGAGCAQMPLDWGPALREVRYVGVRLTDACMTLVQEHGKLTAEELLKHLNNGMFRFRTSSPFREIHAALIKQRRVTKFGDTYVWSGGGEAIQMRPRLETQTTTVAVVEKEATGTEGKK